MDERLPEEKRKRNKGFRYHLVNWGDVHWLTEWVQQFGDWVILGGLLWINGYGDMPLKESFGGGFFWVIFLFFYVVFMAYENVLSCYISDFLFY